MRIISGSLGGRSIKTVERPGCRPAMSKVRGALFSMLESRGVVWNGTRVLDLFAGSGSVGFEAVSRGAAEATFVEADKRVVSCITDNAKRLDLPPETARVFMQRVDHFLKKRTQAPFDVIFADPPYGENLLQPALRSIIKGEWLKPGGMVAAEVEDGLRISDFSPLQMLIDRTYGQTRILIWTLPTDI